MKFLKSSFAIICILLFLVIIFSGCTRNEPGVWINNDIDQGIRNNFQEMNNVLFEGIKANKPIMIEKIMSKQMLEDVRNNRTIELSSIHMRKGKVTMLDEYYMVHEFNRENKIKASGHGINNYTLTYQPTTGKMYVAFYTIKDGTDQWLLSAGYNKLDYGWKLCELDLSPYTISGKTAPELYNLARKQYNKKYLVDALNTMTLSRSCSVPNVMWSYEKDNEMNQFYSTVLEEAEKAYTFPVVVAQVKTKPRIFRVFNQTTSEGTYPMIYYLSNIKLKDTTAIKNENNALKEVVGQIMPGINKDKKYVYYSVFNEMPYTKNKNPDFFEITDKLQ